MTMRTSSEHLFGMTRRRFTWIVEPGTRADKGWFSGSNRGCPFNRNMAKRVLGHMTADERVSDLFEGT